jgi:O-antigen/teichoic acid export membrane protein
VNAQAGVEEQTGVAAIAPLTLRTNVSWTFLGNVVYAASQWGMLALLAKLGTVEMVGQFALGLAVAAPVFMLTNLQLRGVQATDARGEYDFRDYLSLRLLTTALGLAAVVGIGFGAGYSRETAVVVALVGLGKAVESLSDVVYGQLQQRERMDRIAKSLMIRGPLSLLVLGAVLAWTGSLRWAVLGLALSWFATLVAYDLPWGLRFGAALRLQTRTAVLWKLAWLALPLGVVMMFISLTVNIPRYLIEHELGARKLGVFAALSYVLLAGTTVVSAVGQSASPRLSRLYAAGDVRGFGRLLTKLVAIGGGLGLAGVAVAAVAGGPLLRLLYTAKYVAHSDLFTALMGAAAVTYVVSFLGYGMTAARYFRAQLPIFAAVASATLAVGWWTIPVYGRSGGVMALLAGALVQGAGSGLVIWHALRSATPK